MSRSGATRIRRALLTLTLLASSQFVWRTTVFAQPMPVGPQFQINTFTTYGQFSPKVASDAAGNFIVVWESHGNASSPSYLVTSILAQRYDSSGAARGGEFQVNSYSFAFAPAVAADGAGNFVVVWVGYSDAGNDTSSSSIQAQRYDSSGVALGEQFQVNSYTTSYQSYPAIAADGAGNFVVVWTSFGSPGSDSSLQSIRGKRFNSSGAAISGDFQVNTYTTDQQNAAAVAADSAGRFVVVWVSFGSGGSDTSRESIQARRYDSSGSPLGDQFQVNTYTTNEQAVPAVAADSAGNFVIVWQSDGSADGSGTPYGPGPPQNPHVRGRRYDSNGTPRGSEFNVSTYTTGLQFVPAIAADGAGNFIVTWGSAESETSGVSGLRGRRYDNRGTPENEFQVNTYTTSWGPAAVAADSAGNFVVTWNSAGSVGSDTSETSIQGQRFAAPAPRSTTSMLPGRIGVIKSGTRARFVAKPVAGDTFVLPSANPVTAGGSLRIFDVAAAAGDNSYDLPAGPAWKGLGTPAGSKGYRYSGAGTSNDPCTVVLVKKSVIKGVCTGSGVALTPPFSGDVGIVLSLGETDRYCAQFGGKEASNDTTLTKRKNAPAPGACPQSGS